MVRRMQLRHVAAPQPSTGGTIDDVKAMVERLRTLPDDARQILTELRTSPAAMTLANPGEAVRSAAKDAAVSLLFLSLGAGAAFALGYVVVSRYILPSDKK